MAFLCAASYKWLCAGPGIGILYASQAVMDRLEPGGASTTILFPGMLLERELVCACTAAPAAGWFGQAVDGRNYELLV